MLNPVEKLNKCHETKCSKEQKAYKKLEDKIKKELEKLYNNLSNNKIDNPTYQKEKLKLKLENFNSKTAMALKSCSIDKCNNEAINSLKFGYDEIKSLCEKYKNPTLCEKVKRLGDELKKIDPDVKVNIELYTKLMDIFIEK